MARALDMNSRTDAAELTRQERAIAAKYQGGFPWLMAFWGVGNSCVWVALWPLTLTGLIPLWLTFIVATANVMLSYLPSHDAQHDIFIARGSKRHWINELIGHVSIFPLVLAFRTARETHLGHHRHANDPALDPDYPSHAPNAWAALWKTIENRQPGSAGKARYGAYLTAKGTHAAKIALRDGLLMQTFFYTVLAAMAWAGYAIEVALLWWLPRHIAQTYISFFLSWAPHHPAQEQGRYRETRAFKSRLGNLGSMGMQYHIVHHLYPTIPLTKTPAAYRELRPILEARGCELGGLER
jgi:beta-carotene hydroxylase